MYLDGDEVRDDPARIGLRAGPDDLEGNDTPGIIRQEGKPSSGNS